MSLTRRTSESVSLDMSLNLVDSLVDALSSSVLYVVSSIRTVFDSRRLDFLVFAVGVVFTCTTFGYNRLLLVGVPVVNNNGLVHQEHAPAVQSEEMSEWYTCATERLVYINPTKSWRFRSNMEISKFNPNTKSQEPGSPH